MNLMFILTVISVFVSVAAESLSLIIQLKTKMLSKILGNMAFTVHMFITSLFWSIAFCFFILLQFEEHPLFHENTFLKYAGLAVAVSGMVLSSFGLKLLGFRRSLGLNFFKDQVPVVKSSIYKYIHNPIDYGFWMVLAGFACFTGSLYNLVIAAEYIVVMIPHIYLESIPLKDTSREHT